MSHVSGWLLIRLLQGLEFVATQWVFTTVLGKSCVVVSCWALAPLAVLLCCPLDGETQIWLGDLRLAFCFWVLLLLS